MKTKLEQPKFGKRIVFLRAISDPPLAQIVLATAVGVRAGWLSGIERGQSQCGEDLRKRIADYFDVDVDTLEPKGE